MTTTADVLRIELALAQLVYCDECTWQGHVAECRQGKSGWLRCPDCKGQQIFEANLRTLH